MTKHVHLLHLCQSPRQTVRAVVPHRREAASNVANSWGENDFLSLGKSCYSLDNGGTLGVVSLGYMELIIKSTISRVPPPFSRRDSIFHLAKMYTNTITCTFYQYQTVGTVPSIYCFTTQWTGKMSDYQFHSQHWSSLGMHQPKASSGGNRFCSL